MRFVVYTYDLEPITVLDLPGMTTEVIEGYNRHFMLAVPENISPTRDDYSAAYTPRTVLLRFERFVRDNVMSWMCFTSQEELAMLLEPTYLPGQRIALLEREKYTRFLEQLLMEVI